MRRCNFRAIFTQPQLDGLRGGSFQIVPKGIHWLQAEVRWDPQCIGRHQATPEFRPSEAR